MKKIFLIFIMMLSVSSIFSAPKIKPFEEWPNSEKERIFYNRELRKYGLYDIDGIEYEVKVELVKRLAKRHKEEIKYYKELIENPSNDFEFTNYDIKMIESIKAERLHQKMVQEMKTEREKYITKETNANNKKQRIHSEEEIELFEKIKQDNQKKLEQIDKKIMLLEESN